MFKIINNYEDMEKEIIINNFKELDEYILNDLNVNQITSIYIKNIDDTIHNIDDWNKLKENVNWESFSIKIKEYKNYGVQDNYICPLCNEKEVNLYIVDKNKTDCMEKTYIWVCELCPHIGFEYWDDEDLENLNLYLKKEIKERK